MEGPKSVTLRDVGQSPRPSVLTVGDIDMRSKASVFAYRDVRSRASMAAGKDAKSYYSTHRDLESRICKTKDGHKSRASSTHKDYGAYVRKGRTDLSSASRELLRRRLHSTGFDSYGSNTRQTSRVAGMEELPDPDEQQQSGELGQLFTVLRPCRRDAAIICWPKDVLIQKFYPPHDQRHAMPLSIGPVGVSDMFGETGRRKSFHIQGPATSVNKYTDKRRLHALLGEFYKDKKYLDKFIDRSGRGSDERFFAERGRDFLYNLAGYWDQQTPLGERPPTTNLGLRLSRSQTWVS